MEILTERLTLKPMNMTYLHSTFEYAGCLENTKFMMFLPYDSIGETEELIRDSEKQWQSEKPNYCEFAIIAENRHIGGITLYFTDDRTVAELGWLLHRDFWNRGYTTEAAIAMLDYAKNTWGVKRVIACCDSENPGSYRVMEKIGMKFVSLSGGRKNRSSDEERKELLYEIYL